MTDPAGSSPARDAHGHSEMPLAFSIERLDSPTGVPVVVLEGELDLAVTEGFRAIVDAVCDEQPPVVVLDFTGVSFIDSTMLRELLRVHRGLTEKGGKLILAGADANVSRLFELTGTIGLFELAPTRAAALAQAG